MEFIIFLALVALVMLFSFLIYRLAEEKRRSRDYLTEIQRLRDAIKADQDATRRIISDYERELQRTKYYGR